MLLGNKIKILSVLPVDSTRIADEGSLLVMDIVVQLESGEIVDLEIQKIGYMFPGQRSACYSSDLLLRQYKRIRSDENEKTFSYRDIKNVYTIFCRNICLYHLTSSRKKCTIKTRKKRKTSLRHGCYSYVTMIRRRFFNYQKTIRNLRRCMRKDIRCAGTLKE
jgi:hypothetical protein